MHVQGLIALWRVMAAILTIAAIGSGAVAHEIPNDVKLNVFFKPAGNRLLLLVRAPLAAMNEAGIPTRGPGYIDLARADEALRGAAKVYLTDNLVVSENGAPLPAPRVLQARISLPSDKSFASYEEALAHLEGPPLDSALDLYWSQQLLDVLLEYPIQSDRSEFTIELRVDRLGHTVTTALRFLPPDGNTRAFEFHGDVGRVYLDPRWHQAALSFVISGFWHILEGTDHLLFLACLVIPFRRLRPLVVIVTSFTVAHSITLIASAFGFASRRAVVPSADRNADRHHHRHHGDREHRLRVAWQERRALKSLDRRLRVRPGAWFRLLVRACARRCNSPVTTS